MNRPAWMTLVFFTCLVLAVVPVYVLCAGPVLWLCNHGYLAMTTYDLAYDPLIQFCSQHARCSQAVDWYLSWWGGTLYPDACVW
jgi:hypothetical protein